MKAKLSGWLVIAAGLLVVAGPVLAHHGAAAFDMTKTLTLQATVTEFRFVNPHVQIFFDAKCDNGRVQKWTAEACSPGTLSKHQWYAALLKPGDHVTIVANRAKNGSNSMHLRKVILANGRALDPGGDPPS